MAVPPANLLNQLMERGDEPYEDNPNVYEIWKPLAQLEGRDMRKRALAESARGPVVRKALGGGVPVPGGVQPVIPPLAEQKENLRRSLMKQDIGDPRAVDWDTPLWLHEFSQREEAKELERLKQRGAMPLGGALSEPRDTLAPENRYNDIMVDFQRRLDETKAAIEQWQRDRKVQEYDPQKGKGKELSEREKRLRDMWNQLELEYRWLEDRKYQDRGDALDRFLKDRHGT